LVGLAEELLKDFIAVLAAVKGRVLYARVLRQVRWVENNGVKFYFGYVFK